MESEAVCWNACSYGKLCVCAVEYGSCWPHVLSTDTAGVTEGLNSYPPSAFTVNGC